MLSIGNDRIAMTIAPNYGARVVALTDRKSGRQWLVTGPQSTQTGKDAVYGADEAAGWDECFPTVLTCNHPAWNGQLRDHGALWGRRWSVDRLEADGIKMSFNARQFRFSRRLTVRGTAVIADYCVTNIGPRRLPYLWSQHCLLATLPGDRILLKGPENLRDGDCHFSWPHHPDRDLSIVGPISEGIALKVYAETPDHALAAIVGPNGGLCLEWDDVPAFGLWLCYGGWLKGKPVHHVALEPTTSAADHLADAERMGQARALDPNETHKWSVGMSLIAPEERTVQDE